MRFPIDLKALAIAGSAQEFMKAGTGDAEETRQLPATKNSPAYELGGRHECNFAMYDFNARRVDSRRAHGMWINSG
ncbi:hypothetical protein [uncultured Nevskia sp.]|uniref:hypothetical protein n=1 Tax=uncultured Nevskia sp. TaxID=228950 RepID=UPI0025D61901|nr:hypothetical protein [uncultured Nevskia sp.]